MTIKIVTDSTCDLPKALIDEYDITVVPLYVNFGTQSYLDGVELSRRDFYARLQTFDAAPTTSTPSPGAFHKAYARLAEEGATEILSIHISISLSATINVARLVAQEETPVPVTPFDSRQLSMGMGFMVLRAAQMAADGHTMPEILDALEEQTVRTHTFAALDTLEFLRRSGRMGWAASKLGTLLRIKPLLYMNDGAPTAHRVRTGARAVERLVDWMTELLPLEKVAVLHGGVPDRVEALRQRVQDILPPANLSGLLINPVLGSHIGPGTLGFACVRA